MFASKTFNIRKEVNPSFCFAVLILSRLFSCNAWFPNNLIQKKLYLVETLQKPPTIKFFHCLNELLYFNWYPEAFFPSVAFNLLAPFPRYKPLKKVFRGQFWPSSKIFWLKYFFVRALTLLIQCARNKLLLLSLSLPLPLILLLWWTIQYDA